MGGEDCLDLYYCQQGYISEGSVSGNFCKKIQQSVIWDFQQIEVAGNGGGLHGGFQRFAVAS